MPRRLPASVISPVGGPVERCDPRGEMVGGVDVLRVAGRVLGVSVWGGLLVMVGTVFATSGGGGWFWLGLAALAAGNWVFLVGLANRVFPGRVLVVSDLWELGLVGLMGVSVLGWAVTILFGGSL